MSWSIGDLIAHTAGVTCTPEIRSHKLGGSEKALVVASDGLWEFLSNEEVLEIVKEFHDLDSENPQNAADWLREVSEMRWQQNENLVDDTTIIVVFLN